MYAVEACNENEHRWGKGKREKPSKLQSLPLSTFSITLPYLHYYTPQTHPAGFCLLLPPQRTTQLHSTTSPSPSTMFITAATPVRAAALCSGRMALAAAAGRRAASTNAGASAAATAQQAKDKAADVADKAKDQASSAADSAKSAVGKASATGSKILGQIEERAGGLLGCAWCLVPCSEQLLMCDSLQPTASQSPTTSPSPEK